MFCLMIFLLMLSVTNAVAGGEGATDEVEAARTSASQVAVHIDLLTSSSSLNGPLVDMRDVPEQLSSFVATHHQRPAAPMPSSPVSPVSTASSLSYSPASETGANTASSADLIDFSGDLLSFQPQPRSFTPTLLDQVQTDKWNELLLQSIQGDVLQPERRHPSPPPAASKQHLLDTPLHSVNAGQADAELEFLRKARWAQELKEKKEETERHQEAATAALLEKIARM